MITETEKKIVEEYLAERGFPDLEHITVEELAIVLAEYIEESSMSSSSITLDEFNALL